MADYETEEQQVEALKDWWKENGTAVISGAVLGVMALGGWKGWGWYQEKQANQASDLYSKVQEAVIKNDSALLQSNAHSLQSNYASTPYATLAVLHKAKLQAESSDLAAAAESLQWVVNNSNQENIRSIARIRLARVYVAENKFDEALKIINRDFSEAYASLVNEIRGDIFVAKGETEQAKQAYDQALKTADASSIEFLQMKRNDLGS